MQRRTLLRRSAALGAIGLAGCTSDDADPATGDGNGDSPAGDGDDTGDGTPTDTATPTPASFTGFEGTSTETTNTSCDSGSAGTADVAFDAEALRVTVTGALRASNPCHVASFEGAKYDPASDELRVTIAAKPEAADGCVQCIGAIEYRATLDLKGALPGTVVVKHGTGSDASVVATVSNDASE